MIRPLLLFAALVALGYVALVVLLWVFQERIVFQPPAGRDARTGPWRRVRYVAQDGIALFAYVVGERRQDAPVVLAFHGNADVAHELIPWATVLARETGSCVVLPEYRGYAGLGGKPTYAGSALDARAALMCVREELHATASSLVYFGHSLGSAIAAELAAFSAPRTLVLQAPFSSARAVGSQRYLPGLTIFWDLISRVGFDTLRRVQTLPVPVWVVHGDHDSVIPVWMGRQVYQAAAHKGTLLIVRGAGHNDLPEVGGAAYWSWLADAVGSVPVAVNRGAPTGTRLEP